MAGLEGAESLDVLIELHEGPGIERISKLMYLGAKKILDTIAVRCSKAARRFGVTPR